jgi:hypothetical protein
MRPRLPSEQPWKGLGSWPNERKRGPSLAGPHAPASTRRRQELANANRLACTSSPTDGFSNAGMRAWVTPHSFRSSKLDWIECPGPHPECDCCCPNAPGIVVLRKVPDTGGRRAWRLQVPGETANGRKNDDAIHIILSGAGPAVSSFGPSWKGPFFRAARLASAIGRGTSTHNRNR